MICYCCLEKVEEPTTWGTFLTFTHKTICSYCEDQLEKVSFHHCSKCAKEIPRSKLICRDCVQWKNLFEEDPLVKNISLYQYNDFMREIIAKFKYRGDYEVSYAFQNQMQQSYEHHFKKLKLNIVPIPLSDSRQKERGFNQAEALALHLEKTPLTNLLYRKESFHEEKQSKRSKFERIHSNQTFYTSATVPENILLIDDLYTTGTTIRQAAIVLKKSGAKSVYSFTLIRS
ncbi:ComF family protein [Halalkalibacillus halophilus]|uniref:ComF family protein n=1 Tax=Halalkalibacillus halophilus TaxID=392827 RepID=UPI0004154949|nr:ComF family protein [Halalkalibacillus halophilus]